MEEYLVDFTRKEYHCGTVIVLAKSEEDARRKVKENNLTESEPVDRDFFAHEDEIEEAKLLEE